LNTTPPDRVKMAEEVRDILRASTEADITSIIANVDTQIIIGIRTPDNLFGVMYTTGINVSVGPGPSIPNSFGKEEWLQRIYVQCFVRGTRPEEDHKAVVALGEAVEREVKKPANQILVLTGAKFQQTPDFDVDLPFSDMDKYLNLVTVFVEYWKTH